MKIIATISTAIICGIIIFTACSWTTGVEDLVFPAQDVSYMLHVQPFMSMNCSYSPCHSSPSDPQSGGIVLTQYHYMMSVGGLIVPGNPDGSRLVQILEGTSPHFTNFYRGNITDNQIKGIRQWIKEGAVNN